MTFYRYSFVTFFILLLPFSPIFWRATGSEASGQNISVNTTGSANSTSSMFEILQGTAATKILHLTNSGAGAGTAYGLYSTITGASTTSYGLYSTVTGGSTTNVGGYFTTTGAATNNYAAIFDQGNVGIGTTAPTVLLDMAKAQDAVTSIQLTNSNAGLSSFVSIAAISDAASIGLRAHASARTSTRYGIALGGYTELLANGSNGLLIGTNATDKPIIFGSNSLERMRINTGGNAGIGTTSPQSKLDVEGNVAIGATYSGTTAAPSNGLIVEGNAGIGTTSATLGRLCISDAAVHMVVTETDQALPAGLWRMPADGAVLRFDRNTAVGGDFSTFHTPIAMMSNGDVRLGGSSILSGGTVTLSVLANDGNVGIGTGTSAPGDKLEVVGTVRATGHRCRTGSAGVYGGNVFNINWTGTQADLWIDGSIQVSGIVSDRRLKENIHPLMDDGLSRLMELRPVSFKYKMVNEVFTGSPITYEGFIADEVQEVIPSAVNGEKDALTKDGGIQPQTLNPLPIISLLTKAMQEQQKMIKDLQNTVGDLRSEIQNLKAKIPTR